MDQDTQITSSPPLADATCSPALAGLIERLEKAADEAFEMRTKAKCLYLKGRASGYAAACLTFAYVARQCQESAEPSHKAV